MCTLTQSVSYDCFIETSHGWFAIKCCTDIHGPQTVFSYPLTFCPVPMSGQNL